MSISRESSSRCSHTSTTPLKTPHNQTYSVCFVVSVRIAFLQFCAFSPQATHSPILLSILQERENTTPLSKAPSSLSLLRERTKRGLLDYSVPVAVTPVRVCAHDNNTIRISIRRTARAAALSSFISLPLCLPLSVRSLSRSVMSLYSLPLLSLHSLPPLLFIPCQCEKCCSRSFALVVHAVLLVILRDLPASDRPLLLSHLICLNTS